MTKEEFIDHYCGKSKILWDELKDDLVALPCDCGDRTCKGWAMVTNNQRAIDTHNELYTHDV